MHLAVQATVPSMADPPPSAAPSPGPGPGPSPALWRPVPVEVIPDEEFDLLNRAVEEAEELAARAGECCLRRCMRYSVHFQV
jgi:hypothetical protein